MGRQDQIIQERMKKLSALRVEKINPYPNKYEIKDRAKELQDKHKKLKKGSLTKTKTKVAGRLLTLRNFGNIAFGVLKDGTGTIQITLQKDHTPKPVLDFFKKYIDSGDFVGIEGLIGRTDRGELSIYVKKAEILSKSLLPLPEKWHGLQDEEDRYRKRYLDILLSDEVKQTFIRKSHFWNATRNFLLDKGFIEVETPALENTAGGATATPFKTHLNALDIELYLRISMGELWQKKLMVAGFEKTFEIGRQFRNEGIDAEHLQDYTQMEFYWAYANYEDGMNLVKQLYRKIAKDVYKTLKFKRGDHEVDLGKEWKVIDYVTEIKKQTKIDVTKATVQEMESKLKQLGQKYESGAKIRLIDSLWKYCRKNIAGPAFLTGQLVEVSPLAKRSPKRPDIVEQFQVILGGSEIGNGYSELNDPQDQEERFKEQRKLKDEGDQEAQEKDESFIDALKHGMPPTCGFGFSERLFSFFEDKPIRETVIFPLMRPIGHKENKTGKAKDSKLAVAIINKELKMEPWQQMNTIAHLNAAFAARIGKELFIQDEITTKDDNKIKLNIQHAIMIKEATSNNDLIALVKAAKEKELHVSEFTREMIETTDDKKVVDFTKRKNYKDIEFLGVLIFGKKSVIEKLTDQFPLYK